MINITTREAATMMRLLAILQEFLEESIHASLIPGTAIVFDPEDTDQVEVNRRDWRAAENIVKRLEVARDAARRTKKGGRP